jgi:hypothetical protein
MLQPLPQPLIDKPKRKTTTSTTLISYRLVHLVLLKTPLAPSILPRTFHHHHTEINHLKLPLIIIGNTRVTHQEIEVPVIGGDPGTN